MTMHDHHLNDLIKNEMNFLLHINEQNEEQQQQL
jgi:hypothetical protein